MTEILNHHKGVNERFIIEIYNEGMYSFLKEQKYHLYLSKDEYSEVLQSLIRLKNSLIAQGRYTDAADDILCKVLSAKKRKFIGE